MGKVIFWLVVVFVVLAVIRMWNANKLRAGRKGGPDSANPRAPATTPMIRCVECGVFLPATDATTAPDGYRCGDPACPNRKRTSA
jgi:uncharacterized protein